MPLKTITNLINELKDKEDFIKDKEGIRHSKQHQKGKFFARERIAKVLDKDSFQEIDMFVKHYSTNFGLEKKIIPADGINTGFGTINGRKVFIYAQDFSVLGGSLGEMHALKIQKIQDMAIKAGVPIICMNDSGGARIQEGVSSLHGYGGIFYRNVKASGIIPQISVILGPCAGGAVYSPALTDFVFMVNKISQMYITGPKVIKAVTGEDINNEELGGAITHNTISGNGHFVFPDESTCFQAIKELLRYLPSNCYEKPPYLYTDDPKDRKDMILRKIVPTNNKKAYDVRDVIEIIADEGIFFEVQPYYAQNVVIGFASFGGYSTGIVANQPKILAGVLDINSSDKAARFIRFCDAFNIPLLTLVDVPGFLPGKDQEFGGIIRHGAKIIYAYSEASVPKLTVTLRKSYGGAYIGMCCKDLGSDWSVAWPQAEIAVMGSQGAANIIFRREIKGADNPEQKMREKIAEYETQFSNPYEAAKRGYIDGIIRPEYTRKSIIEALEMFRNKRELQLNKKHGNMPL